MKGKSRRDLELALGHRFKRKALLEQALTHASAREGNGAAPDNERLEFLGDRVLGLVIAEVICEQFPEASEGDLARRFNRLVRRETCAAVATEIGLGPHLVMSVSEHGSGGRAKSNILADACEALLGALYLEAGFEKTRDVIRALWSDHIDGATAVRADPKTALQEWAQSIGPDLPQYKEVKRAGPQHAPSFTAEVRIKGQDPAAGTGPNKRQAEQAAAKAMLERLGLWDVRHD
ncbi:MAG: ribonuclease III [Hyphomicrobiaceae bacterium]